MPRFCLKIKIDIQTTILLIQEKCKLCRHADQLKYDTWLIKKLTSVSGSSSLNSLSGINPIELRYLGVAPAKAISSPIAS